MTSAEQDIGRAIRRLTTRQVTRGGPATRVSLPFDGMLESTVPLAGERASVRGRAAPASDRRPLDRCVARHPDAAAAGRAGFRDPDLHRVDSEGRELRRGIEQARLWFDQPVRDAEGAGIELVRLARRARAEAAKA
jgi:hypothetical protein